jgi:hypothetical protein
MPNAQRSAEIRARIQSIVQELNGLLAELDEPPPGRRLRVVNGEPTLQRAA